MLPRPHVRHLVVAITALLSIAGAPRSADGGQGVSFTPSEVGDWDRRSFAGSTRYRVVEMDGRSAVEAVSRSTASCLYKEVAIDLDDTPYLRWSWRVEAVVPSRDERSAAGDDFAARVLVVVPGRWGALSARTLVYVWSNQVPAGTLWSHPSNDRARYIAVRSGSEGAGAWQMESRDVRADFERAFGESIGELGGIAIMTDTDDTGQSVRAWYGALRFDRS